MSSALVICNNFIKMTDFKQSNAAGRVLHKKVMQFTNSQNICVSCLQQNGPFVNLSTCKHAIFFQIFRKYRVEYNSAMVCQKCHYFIKKMELFKLQVQESLAILSNQAPMKKRSRKIFHDLRISKTESDDIIFKDVPSEIEIDANSPEEHYDEIATEVKIEHEGYSDIEIDAPLSEIKKEMNRDKKKKVKPKRKTLSEKYEGKISVIQLTKKEVLEERERDARENSYFKLPFKCESCITGFDHDLTLKDHMEKRHCTNKGGYHCDICKSVLSSLLSFKEHAKRHFRRYECQECGKRNNNVYSVIRHYNQVHGTIDTEFVCQECGFTTESNRSYRYHRDKHKQKVCCTLCESTFVNNNGLKVHMFTVHKQSSRVYSCEPCNKIYNTKSGLTMHIATVHNASSAPYCASCRTHYRSAHSLAQHLKTHSAHITEKDKKYICDECGVKYLTKTSLQEHIDFVHLKSGKFECTKCNKMFINQSALRKHTNYVHKKIRPPRNKICHHCGRGFTNKKDLSEHEFIHTGERPLSCEICGCTFRQSAALYTHKKGVHKIFPSKKNVTLMENTT